MFTKPTIEIAAFDYALPEEKIAFTPAPNRADSKLLVWDQQIIDTSQYKFIANYLPENAQLFFNNSKVIAARIFFEKPSTNGTSTIEIFCLEPSKEFTPVSIAMEATTQVEWYCLIGGAKKWKEGLLSKEILIEQQKIIFNAEKIANENGQYLIRFSWNNPAISFSELLAHIGNIPLPPYIERAATNEDKDRYQTTYAKEEGSVAAPTAGLHFSKEVFDQLALKNIHSNFVTLHVGAGTFMPVKAATIDEHVMHAEFIDVDASTIQHLMNLFQNNDPKTIVAIGTTSIRTLESLYWLGIQQYHVQKNNQTANTSVLNLSQWEAYELDNTSINTADAFNALLIYLQQQKSGHLFAKTQLMISPGYQFKVCNALVTNFHQPKSTLLCLISAITGDAWKTIYDYALNNEFRFLSYGDGSLLWINNKA
jgi:S-adenosylmethionine:tRNA ribosyltransferase-isomerase